MFTRWEREKTYLRSTKRKRNMCAKKRPMCSPFAVSHSLNYLIMVYLVRHTDKNVGSASFYFCVCFSCSFALFTLLFVSTLCSVIYTTAPNGNAMEKHKRHNEILNFEKTFDRQARFWIFKNVQWQKCSLEKRIMTDKRENNTQRKISAWALKLCSIQRLCTE